MNTMLPNLHRQPTQPNGFDSALPAALYESFSKLIQSVYCPGTARAVRSVMLTSTHPGSGVSYIASCLSTRLAEMLGASLLIDGQALAYLASRGVVPMRSHCSSVRQTGLSVLGRTEAAQVKVHAEKAKRGIEFVMDSLLNDFQYVVVDAPALSASKVARSISGHVDGVLIVVVPHETDIADLAAARRTLIASGGVLLGAIYNKVNANSESATGCAPCSE